MTENAPLNDPVGSGGERRDRGPLRLEPDWDAVVIGGGPAGFSTAIPLARSGLRVLLVERKRFPRDKVCGGCLNLGAVRRLAELGLGEALSAAGGVPLQRFHWASQGRQVTIAAPGGLALSRATLDELLRRRAESEGVRVLTGTMARVESCGPAARGVTLDDGRSRTTVAGAVVVVAAGLAGQTLPGPPEASVVVRGSHVGVGGILRGGTDFPAGTIHMAVGREGYVGVARGEAGRLMVAAALAPGRLRELGSREACRTLLARNGWTLPPETPDEEWRGTIQLSRRRTPPAGERLFFVGDAAGYVEPFTGEGIGWALEGGRRLAPLVAQGCRRWDADLVDRWTREYRQGVGRRQWTCRALGSMLRSAALVRFGMFVAQRFPGVVRPVVSHLRGIDSRS